MITQFLRRHHAIIPESLAGKRLDQALAAMFEDYSRTNIKSWIEQGQVRVNRHVCRPRDRVSAGDEIELTATFPTGDGPRPQMVDYRVVYSDPDVLVVDKPPGLVVHPGAGNPENTLVNGLLHTFPELDRLPRAGLIHRLDKDTSGVLIVARTPRSYQLLIQQMSERRIKRVYEAVVNGCMISGGTIDAAIGRDARHRTRMAITAAGRPAVTHHRVLRRFRAHTHIEVELETGRTHQIRVHMAHLGFPIVGDVRYGARPVLPPAPEPELEAMLGGFRRHALHAKRVSFTHPSSGSEARFEAPLPVDMRALLDALAADAGRKAAGSQVS